MATNKSFNMFTDLKTPRDVTKYTLYRGTTDFTQLQQFDLFEQGYPYLVCVSIPRFLTKMAEKDTSIAALINSYIHIIEYEFKGLGGGIDDMGSDTSEITNGVQSMNVITKVNGPTATNITMTYQEKAGSTITKVHELYLRGVRDPATTFKTYGGLIGVGDNADIRAEDAGFDKETFSFLYMHTDNTGLLLERAIYYVGCMPTSAQLSIYQGTKGDVSFQDIGVEFTAFPIQGSEVNKRAKAILDWMNSEANSKMVTRNSWDYKYAGLSDTGEGLAQTKLTGTASDTATNTLRYGRL